MVGRVNLMRAGGALRQRQWRDAGSQSSHLTVVSFGRLADGRWFAELHGHRAQREDRDGAYVFTGDKRGHGMALRLAYRWMRELGGQWWPMPAVYGPDAKPSDGLPWVRRGGEWMCEK